MSKIMSWRKRPLSILGLLLLSWATTACHIEPQPQLFTGRGVVKHIAEGGKGVRIAHDDIPGFMQAMTMDFEVKDPTVLTGVRPEDEIEFTVEKASDSVHIIALHVIAQARQDSDEEQSPGATDGGVSGESTPSAGAEAEFAPYPAADFTLTDQDGRSFTLSTLRGKIVLLDFIFTRCPGPCPLLSLKFAQVQEQLGDRLGKDVMLLSVTIDPRWDTPTVLKAYAQRYSANLAGWKFLTGGTRDIIMTATAYGADYQAGAEGIIDHRLLTCVIDRKGTVVKEFGGANHTVDELLTEINKLLS